jgi:hypothetical protein
MLRKKKREQPKKDRMEDHFVRKERERVQIESGQLLLPW